MINNFASAQAEYHEKLQRVAQLVKLNPFLGELHCMLYLTSGITSVTFVPGKADKPKVREWLKAVEVDVFRETIFGGKKCSWKCKLNGVDITFYEMEDKDEEKVTL